MNYEHHLVPVILGSKETVLREETMTGILLNYETISNLKFEQTWNVDKHNFDLPWKWLQFWLLKQLNFPENKLLYSLYSNPLSIQKKKISIFNFIKKKLNLARGELGNSFHVFFPPTIQWSGLIREYRIALLNIFEFL